MKEDGERKANVVEVYKVNEADVPFIEKLSSINFPPWLSVPNESITGRIRVFPEGQLIIRKNGERVGYMFSNRIYWDGDPDKLTHWNKVAGSPTTFEKTFQPNGNTLVMMSIDISSEAQGSGLAKELIVSAKELALELKLKYLIGSFRPNQFGAYKQANNQWGLKFVDYCQMTRDDGLPVDAWLSNLTRNGMRKIKPDMGAMIYTTTAEDFDRIKDNYVGPWVEVERDVWECAQTGRWILDPTEHSATYSENALWGEISI